MSLHADSQSEIGSLTLEWDRHRHAGASARVTTLVAGVVFAVSDALAVASAAVVASLAASAAGFASAPADARIVTVLALASIALMAVFRTYQVVGLAPHEELRRVVLGVSTLFIPLSVVTVLLVQATVISLLTWWVLSAFFLFLARTLTRSLLSRWKRWGVSATVLSNKEFGAKAVALLQRAKRRGYRPEALYRFSSSGKPIPGEPMPHEDAVVVVLPGSNPAEALRIADRYFAQAPTVLSMPTVSANSELWVEPLDRRVQESPRRRRSLVEVSSQIAKRIFDLVTAAILALILLPLFVVIAIVVRIDSRGPIFYSQRRIGRLGRSFEMLKFRTMQPDAETRLADHLQTDAALRREWELYQKLAEDPRMTRVGVLLRKWSLDELPQIINVIRGEMSLVGPRPMFYGQEPHYGEELRLYEEVRPGLTGLWQISGRNRITFRDRALLDGFYVRNWSIWLDIYILIKTPLAILRGEGTPNGGV